MRENLKGHGVKLTASRLLHYIRQCNREFTYKFAKRVANATNKTKSAERLEDAKAMNEQLDAINV